MTESTTDNSNTVTRPLVKVFQKTKLIFIVKFYSFAFVFFIILLLIPNILFNKTTDDSDDQNLSYSVSSVPINAIVDDAPNELTGVKDSFQVLLPKQDKTSYRANILFSIYKTTNVKDLEDYANRQINRIDDLGKFKIQNDSKNCQWIKLDKYSCEIIYEGDNGAYKLKRRRIFVKK